MLQRTRRFRTATPRSSDNRGLETEGQRMDVVIAGGSGFIGSALGRALEADGHRVVRMVRPDSAPATSDTIAWDPGVSRIDAKGLDGVDAVVNLAGVGIGDKRWSDDRKDEILQSRLSATG